MSIIVLLIVLVLFICIKAYRDNKKEQKKEEEARKKTKELFDNDEIIDLLVGYRDNRVVFNLISLINLFKEKKVRYDVVSMGTVNITINIWRDEYKFLIVCNKTNNINEVEISSIKRYKTHDI